MVAKMAHQGRAKGSTRCSEIERSVGTKANHPARPTRVPTIAAVAPTTAPLASMAIRMWRLVAPIEPSMPRARRRRPAITVNPATASRPTKSSPSVLRTSTNASTWTLGLAPRLPIVRPVPLGTLNESRLSWLALRRIETLPGWLLCPGGTRANWVLDHADHPQRPAVLLPQASDVQAEVRGHLAGHRDLGGTGGVAAGVEAHRHMTEGSVRVLGPEVDRRHRAGNRDGKVGDDLHGAEAMPDGRDVSGKAGVGAREADDGVGRPERRIGFQVGGIGGHPEPERGGGDGHDEQGQHERLATPLAPEQPPRPAGHGPPRRGPRAARRRGHGPFPDGGGHGLWLGVSSDSGPGGRAV